MKRLWKYIRPYTWFIIFAVLVKLLGAVMELLLPYLMEIMLDEKVPAGDLKAIYLYGGGMMLCAFGCLGFNIWANRMSAISAGKITRAVRHDLFAKLQSLSARQMDGLTVPSAESRLTSDTYNVNQMLARLQRMGIRAPMLLIGGIAMMLMMDATMALVLIGLLPIIGIVVYFVTKKSIPMYTRQQTALDKVVRVVQENITGIRVIKALSKTEYEKERFHGVNEELSDIGLEAGKITGITNPIATGVLRIGLTLVVLIGAYRVHAGTMDSGVIVAFLQYFVMILNAMLAVTRIFVMMSKGEASAKRVADVLEMEEELLVEECKMQNAKCKIAVSPAATIENAEAIDDRPYGVILSEHSESKDPHPEGTDSSTTPAASLRMTEENRKCHIEFENVSFSYTGIGKNLEDISFCLRKGQTLGILGPTGSGKSTVINLLLRLYDVDEGCVKIDGQDIRTIPYEVLRRKFGVVFQNDFVTEGTIGHNIRFFRELDDEDLVAAAKAAQAEFIEQKEGKMEAEVHVRGNNLSGGQKQRLLIARALAADPEILILDDSSSALDYATDAALRKALRENYRDTTTVLIAQRISSVRHADLIVYLEDGKIIGMGDHEEMMRSCEEYRYLARTQMGSDGSGALM